MSAEQKLEAALLMTALRQYRHNDGEGFVFAYDKSSTERLVAMLTAAVQREPVGFCEDTVLSLAERTFSTEIDEQLAEDVIQYARRLHDLYSASHHAPNKLNVVRDQVTEDEAPSHSLPNWSECNLRVGNSEWLKDNDRKPEHDSLTANPLHEFIYEYDDSDAYKSAWFLHRLEKLIGFIRSEQAPEVKMLVEALEQGFPLLSDDGLDEVEHHCEWAIQRERKRVHSILAAHRKQGDV